MHAGRYTRDYRRRGHRNGVYVRHLGTTWGTIPDLEILRTRTAGFVPAVLDRYQRRTRQVEWRSWARTGPTWRVEKPPRNTLRMSELTP